MGKVTGLFDKHPTRFQEEDTAIETAVARPDTETHITIRPDRVGKHLIHKIKEFTFDEFSPAFLVKHDLTKEFSGVPIPLRGEDRKAFKTEEGLPSVTIAENMAFVIGADPKFKYLEAYAAYIDRLFGQKSADDMAQKANDCADRGEYEDACIYFRAGLALKFNSLPALYGYARTLLQLYSDGNEESYVGNLKAEAIEFFELTTEYYPDFDMGWYYLGYMYLNMGLYIKARLAWSEFLKHGRAQKDIGEIKERISQLREPVNIENGYNAVLSGRWSKGIEILEPYKDSEYSDWWPLWYYLGLAYARTDRHEAAAEAFKKALKGSPRHLESMEELAELYGKQGDKNSEKKYRDKIMLIKEQHLQMHANSPTYKPVQ